MKADTTAITQLPETSPGSLLINVGSALSMVMVLVLALAWLAKRFGLPGRTGRGASMLSVKASCSVGSRERVVVVEAGGEWLVLGVTASHISHLHTLDAPLPAANHQDKPSATPFTSLLARACSKKRPPE